MTSDGLPQAAVVITAREYDALLSAAALFSADLEGRDTTRREREDDKALTRVLRKAKNAGLRWSER